MGIWIFRNSTTFLRSGPFVPINLRFFPEIDHPTPISGTSSSHGMYSASDPHTSSSHSKGGLESSRRSRVFRMRLMTQMTLFGEHNDLLDSDYDAKSFQLLSSLFYSHVNPVCCECWNSVPIGNTYRPRYQQNREYQSVLPISYPCFPYHILETGNPFSSALDIRPKI